MYIVAKDDDLDIYEVVRVDEWQSYLVMQTNIRTREKAEAACRIWHQRELQRKSDSSTTSQP